jgi:hypothetical protein
MIMPILTLIPHPTPLLHAWLLFLTAVLNKANVIPPLNAEKTKMNVERERK